MISPKAILILFVFISINALSFSQKQTIRIATWNIEHMGSTGRGFPELKRKLPARTNKHFKKIAALIKDTLLLNIVAIQEVSITTSENNKSHSKELDAIIKRLGSTWTYYLASVDKTKYDAEMQNAFIYNTANVQLISAFEMSVPDFKVGKKAVFDRVPLVAYFKSTDPKIKNEDFILVNLHLASGKDNDENHLAAMVIIEQNLNNCLKKNGISTREYDRIILGDFNDDPFQKNADGNPIYISTLYDYMALKGYKDYVDESFKSTRMSNNFNSIIDHILVYKNLQNNIDHSKASIYLPPNKSEKDFFKWRSNYSDHFPVYIEIGLN